MNRNEGNGDSFAELARVLLDERDSILEQWRANFGGSREEKLVETISRQEFLDDIPNFLDNFCSQLRGDPVPVSRPARRHGAHRWRQGLTFAEVTHEWSLLHRILIERVEARWACVGLAVELLPRVFWLLADSVQRAIETSLAEYYTRVSAQAEARVRDLESVLERREDQDIIRGRGLHEASHDLRGSLQVIQTACYVLRHKDLESDTKQILDRQAYAIDNLNSLFEELLDLARLEAGRETRRLTKLDVATLLRELTNSMQPRADAAGLDLRIVGECTLDVCTDPSKIRRIAQNLILNALTHTRAGTIEIGWHVDSPTNWLFYVHDSGPGMAITDDRSFARNLYSAGKNSGCADEPAARSPASRSASYHDDAPGEGIGLAIVHQLCEVLDAVLEISSPAGSGTIFRVRLPLHYESSEDSIAGVPA